MYRFIFPLILFYLAFSGSPNAQFRISIQGGSVIPTGYLEDAVEVGYGIQSSVSYLPINPYIEFSFSTGYYYCGFKEDLPDYNFSFSTIPVLAGLRINFTDYDFIPYAGVEGGAFFPKYLLEKDYGYLGKSSKITNDTNLGISPFIGFRINLNPYFDVDVNARYNRIKTIYIARSFLAIQTGFAIRF